MRRVTRARVRRGLVWAGLGIGAFGVLGTGFSLIAAVMLHWGGRTVSLGSGAITVRWSMPPRNWTSAALNSPGPVNDPAGVAFHIGLPERWLMLPRLNDPRSGGAGPSALPGQLVIPLWLPIVLGSVALYRVLPEGAPTRRPGDRCPGCRFDLSGAPVIDVRRVHVRCPECGVIAEREERAERAGSA